MANKTGVTPTWSFITVSFNSADQLARFWRDDRPEDVEWIVADNASKDDSCDIAKAAGARVLELPTNRGFAVANNIGLASARGVYTAFVNPDVAVDWRSLGALAAEIDSTGGIVAPQLVDVDEPLRLQPNGRNLPFPKRKVANRDVLPSLFPVRDYAVRAQPGERRQVVWVMGAAVLGRTETFRRLSGWDERFFLYYEDHDLGLRARLSGLTVTLLGDVRWAHSWARATAGQPLSRAHWYELQSAWRFYRKYPWLLSEWATNRLSSEPIATLVESTRLR